VTNAKKKKKKKRGKGKNHCVFCFDGMRKADTQVMVLGGKDRSTEGGKENVTVRYDRTKGFCPRIRKGGKGDPSSMAKH